MRLRNITGADTYIEKSEFVIQNPSAHKGCWEEVFGKKAPLYIEVGMGKGQFLMQLAGLHPDMNFIGIEMYSSALLRAVQKMEENPIDNLRFIRMDAREIEEIFAPGEVDKIYLNFFLDQSMLNILFLMYSYISIPFIYISNIYYLFFIIIL